MEQVAPQSTTADAAGQQVIMFSDHDNHILGSAYRAPFYFKGYRFRSLDQYYYVRMALYFKAYDIAKAMLSCNNANRCVALAKQLINFEPDEWHHRSEDIMHQGLREKFRQNQRARDALVNTGNARLVFVSPNDARWGNGLDEEESRLTDVDLHPGSNRLGKLLTKVRNEIVNSLHK